MRIKKTEHGLWHVVGQKKMWPTKEHAQKHKRSLKRRRKR